MGFNSGFKGLKETKMERLRERMKDKQKKEKGKKF